MKELEHKKFSEFVITTPNGLLNKKWHEFLLYKQSKVAMTITTTALTITLKTKDRK